MLLIVGALFACATSDARADQKPEPPKTALSVLNLFEGRLPALKPPAHPVVEVTDTSEDTAPAAEAVELPSDAEGQAPAAQSKRPSGPEFVSNDPKSHIVPPTEDPRVRINPEAPGPFKAMATAFQEGDMETARAYADQYVRYQINLMFEVRELTKLIGDALIKQGLVEEEDMVGVDQYIDVTFARARNENGAILKPTHKQAMERIKPDPEGRADVYFFFTLNCSWCREMAPDMERVWRATKNDKRVRMVALAIGFQNKQWIDSYRQYTGLTMPIMDGTDAAKAMRIGLVPAVVVVSPGNNVSYLKTGKQDFERLWEFVRRVQGLDGALTPELQRLALKPIGEGEIAKAKGGALWEERRPQKALTAGEVKLTPVGGKRTGGSATVERF